jgi:hypothetical protein
MFHGVTKSGSPTPRDMTSFIPITRSKNTLMPEGGMVSAGLDILMFIALSLTKNSNVKAQNCCVAKATWNFSF